MAGKALPKIVVVGSGWAGIAAARTLQQESRASVTVLEAAPRVGGRSCSAVLSDGQVVELGSTWLHGLVGNPIYELAVAWGIMDPTLKIEESFWRGSCCVREQQPVPVDKSVAAVASAAFKAYSEAVEESQDHSVSSVGEFLRRRFQQLRGKRESETEEAVFAEAWACRELLQRAIDGPDSSDAACAAGLDEYELLPGPNMPVPGGYSAMAERLAEGLDVRLSTPVTRICWEGSQVTVEYEGGSMAADAVIVTVSLGVLKEQHEELFAPALPAAKVDAIARLGMGIIDKVFVTFDADRMAKLAAEQASTPGPHPTQYQLLYKVDPSSLLPHNKEPATLPAVDQAMKGVPIAPSEWHRGVYAVRLGGPEFIRPAGKAREMASTLPHLNTAAAGLSIGRSSAKVATNGSLQAGGPGAVVATPKLRGMESSKQDVVTGANGKGNGLARGCSAVIWVTGTHAVDMELASEEQLRDGILAILDTFPAIKLPREFEVVRSCWGTNPCFRGSYSYVRTGALGEDVDQLGQPLEVVRDGLSIPVLCFAGEATSRHHFGTVHGAFGSGQREARRLIQALGLAN